MYLLPVVSSTYRAWFSLDGQAKSSIPIRVLVDKILHVIVYPFIISIEVSIGPRKTHTLPAQKVLLANRSCGLG